MSESVIIPSRRDVRAMLDSPDSDRCVVACPPHPQMGGSRSDPRLQAVSDAVGCACLRFDYGAWDGGDGELADTRDAYAWAHDRYDRVSLFGYSFGGCLALVAGADESTAGTPPATVVALSPAATINPDIVARDAIPDIECPFAVLYGDRDTTVDAEPIADRARAYGGDVVVFNADHHFVGQLQKVAERVASFFP